LSDRDTPLGYGELTRHAESDPALLPPETVDGSKHPRKVAGVLELAEKVISKSERVKGVAAAWEMIAERTTRAEEGRWGYMSIVRSRPGDGAAARSWSDARRREAHGAGILSEDQRLLVEMLSENHVMISCSEPVMHPTCLQSDSDWLGVGDMQPGFDGTHTALQRARLRHVANQTSKCGKNSATHKQPPIVEWAVATSDQQQLYSSSCDATSEGACG
jgi:hypothetical protein